MTEDSASSEPTRRESARYVDDIEARIMGFPRSLRRSDVGELANVSAEDTRRLWRSLGFANARDDDVVFSEADVRALAEVSAMVSEGLVDAETARSFARALGRTTDRLAMWQTQLVADMVSGDGGVGIDSQVAHDAAELVADLADRIEPLLIYSWRRNLTVAISRMVADSEPESPVGVMRTVGFADLVSFTQLVRQLSERELAQLVMRFEALASDIVSQHGGALVKTVGDEVLFTHQDKEQAVRIAFDLLDAAAADDLVPRMRVGMANGRVLARLGDIFGNTVNRASRLTSQARPGTVLADADIAAAVTGQPGVRATAIEPIDLPGIGELQPWALRRLPVNSPHEGDA